MKTKKNVFLVIGLVLVAILIAFMIIAKFVFAANRGLDSGGVAYVCTMAGTIEGTSTDTPMINPIAVKTIVFDAADVDSDVVILTDGVDAETMLSIKGSQVVSFGEGKVFKKGLRVHTITSGATLYIYTK